MQFNPFLGRKFVYLKGDGKVTEDHGIAVGSAAFYTDHFLLDGKVIEVS